VTVNFSGLYLCKEWVVKDGTWVIRFPLKREAQICNCVLIVLVGDEIMRLEVDSHVGGLARICPKVVACVGGSQFALMSMLMGVCMSAWSGWWGCHHMGV
jgi:hypothetical protein